MSMAKLEKKREITKSDIFYLVVLILSLMIMVASVTLAYFSVVASDSEDNTKLYTGTLIVDFIDGRVINEPVLIPRYSPSSINDVINAYVNEFEIENKGTLDQKISLYMDVFKNEFLDNSIKYALFDKNGVKISEGYVNGTSSVLMSNNKYIKNGNKEKYTVMLWLQENDTNQDDEMGKKLGINLRVEAVQDIK